MTSGSENYTEPTISPDGPDNHQEITRGRPESLRAQEKESGREAEAEAEARESENLG